MAFISKTIRKIPTFLNTCYCSNFFEDMLKFLSDIINFGKKWCSGHTWKEGAFCSCLTIWPRKTGTADCCCWIRCCWSRAGLASVAIFSACIFFARYFWFALHWGEVGLLVKWRAFLRGWSCSSLTSTRTWLSATEHKGHLHVLLWFSKKRFFCEIVNRGKL